MMLLFIAIIASLIPLTQLSISIAAFCNSRVVFQLVLVKIAIILRQILLRNGIGWVVQAQFTSAILPPFFHSSICADISWTTRIPQERKGIFALGDRPEPLPQRLGPKHRALLAGPWRLSRTAPTPSA